MLSGLEDDDDGSAVDSSDGFSGLGSADTAGSADTFGSLAGLGSTFEIGSAVTPTISLSICFDDGSAVDGSPYKNINSTNRINKTQKFFSEN